MSRLRAYSAALACALCLVSGRSAAQELRAEPITAENAGVLRIGGPDAIGGVGDWWLANDVIEVVVDDPSRRHAKLNHGGTIVDVGLRDRDGEDQFARLIPLVNMSQRVFLDYDAIRAEVDAETGTARLVVTSDGMSSVRRGGALARALDPLVPEPEALRDVQVETVYEVRRGEDFVRITTRFSNAGRAPAPVFAFGDLWMRGGRSMRSFAGNVLDPSLAKGFHHTSFSRSNLLASFDAMAAFSHVAMAGLPAYPPIAYALYAPERTAAGRSFFGVTGEHVSFAMSFLADDGWPTFGPLQFLGARRAQLAPGQSWEITRRLLVAPRADVAAATDRILPALGAADGATGIAGTVEPRDVDTAIHVATPEGFRVTQTRSRDGRFSAVLPPGEYVLTLRAPHRAPVEQTVRVTQGGVAQASPVRWPALGTLRLAGVFEGGEPGRIVVQGRDGTPDPVFGAELLDFRLDDAGVPSATETNALVFVGNEHDPIEVELPLGRYRLVATRGPEYDAAVQEVALVQADVAVGAAPVVLDRIARLDDFVGADLHVHAQASDDSGTTNDERVRDFAAAGIDVLVASDHDHVPDYDAALVRQGLVGRLRVVTGVEITSSAPSHAAPWTLGHHNAWPMARDDAAHRGGAPPSQELTVGALYALLRADYGARVVQLNHPRPKGRGLREGNFFTHQGSVGAAVDAALPLEDPANAALLAASADGTRAIDFDAVELMNGSHWGAFLETRRDLHWLLRQGVRRTGTANSDTHGPDELAGYPRNYVRVDRSAWWWEDRDLDAALRAGRSFGTTGPLLTRFSVAGAEMGETVSAGPSLDVAYEVTAAPWVPVDEVRIVVNGEVVRVLTERAGVVALELEHDAYVVLEAGAPLEADPALWTATHRGLYTDAIAPGFLPAAFSNPVYVDVDGDGRWTAPGLPPAAPTGATARSVVVLAGLAWIGAASWARRRRRRS